MSHSAFAIINADMGVSDMNKRIISILLTTAVLISGCNAKASGNVPSSPSEPTVVTTSVEPEITTTGTEKQLFEYNPHPHVSFLSGDIPEDYWESFNNLSDALRKGESTFKCSSEEAYKWCTYWGTLYILMPAASLMIEGESKDGTVPFENGTGRIYYQMPVEDFVARQAEFEKAVMDIINSCVEKDDTDFEKCLKLYDYIESNFIYEDYGVNGNDDSCYYTMMNRKGLCAQLAAVYAHLLLQCGVEAISVGCYDPSISHSWTYMIIDGKAYHSDPTWALKDTEHTDLLHLYYFLMDESRRNESCPVKDLQSLILPNYQESRSNTDFSASDDSLCFPQQADFDSLDEDKKVVRYHVTEEIEELRYN